jgi:hypothetical protein
VRRRQGGLTRRVAGGAIALAAFLVAATGAAAQPRYRPPAQYLQLGQPDQEEGRKILEEFRQRGIAGDYYLEFELRVMPRRGPEQVRRGQVRGTRGADGPVSRVSVRSGDAASEVRLLVRSGAHPALWRWPAAQEGTPQPLDLGAMFEPVAGTDLTAFDLQMPFLYWPDFTYEGLARMLGRPAHQFLLCPPPEMAARRPELTGVRVYLDTQYGALVRAELIGPEGRTVKTVSLGGVKKIGEQWIVKTVDLRDEATRNKTRFTVTAAALDLHLSADLFDPAALAAPLPPPVGVVPLATP